VPLVSPPRLNCRSMTIIYTLSFNKETIAPRVDVPRNSNFTCGVETHKLFPLPAALMVHTDQRASKKDDDQGFAVSVCLLQPLPTAIEIKRIERIVRFISSSSFFRFADALGPGVNTNL